MSTTPIADAIRRIEDRIGDERYWCRGEYSSYLGDGRYARCLTGAAMPEGADGLSGFLADTLDAYCGERIVSRFNDDPDTSHTDVMLFLATALDVAESEGL